MCSTSRGKAHKSSNRRGSQPEVPSRTSLIPQNNGATGPTMAPVGEPTWAERNSQQTLLKSGRPDKASVGVVPTRAVRRNSLLPEALAPAVPYDALGRTSPGRRAGATGRRRETWTQAPLLSTLQRERPAAARAHSTASDTRGFSARLPGAKECRPVRRRAGHGAAAIAMETHTGESKERRLLAGRISYTETTCEGTQLQVLLFTCLSGPWTPPAAPLHR